MKNGQTTNLLIWMVRTLRRKQHAPDFSGASTLELMKKEAFPVIVVPFNGILTSVKVRVLNSTQIRACGAFSIIDISIEAAKKKELSFEEICEIKNAHEKILRECLIEPTYDELVSYVYGEEIEAKKKLAEEIKKKITLVEDKVQKRNLTEELTDIELWMGYTLPEDFTATIVSFQLGVDRGDIRKINRDILLEAAILAEKGHDNPIDHITGNFEEYHLEEINKSAWIVLDEFKKQKEIERKASKNGGILINRPPKG